MAPRPKEQFPYSSASSLAAESPCKKSFWSFLYLSSSSAYAHQASVRRQRGRRRREVQVGVRGVGGVGAQGECGCAGQAAVRWGGGVLHSGADAGGHRRAGPTRSGRTVHALEMADGE